jgi:hypothetical protein
MKKYTSILPLIFNKKRNIPLPAHKKQPPLIRVDCGGCRADREQTLVSRCPAFICREWN